jgi:hypothetical protein
VKKNRRTAAPSLQAIGLSSVGLARARADQGSVAAVTLLRTVAWAAGMGKGERGSDARSRAVVAYSPVSFLHVGQVVAVSPVADTTFFIVSVVFPGWI